MRATSTNERFLAALLVIATVGASGFGAYASARVERHLIAALVLLPAIVAVVVFFKRKPTG